MANISLIQTVAGTNTGFASSVTATLSGTIGNTFVAVVEADTVAQNGVTVTDSLGNTWTRCNSTSLAATFDLEVWIAPITKGGTTIVTAADNGGGVDSLIIVREFQGLDPNPIDAVSHGATGSSTALNSGASTTTAQAEELIIGAGVVSANNATMTAAGSYTNITKTATTFSTLATEFLITTGTGTQTATMTSGTSGSWVCSVVALKGRGDTNIGNAYRYVKVGDGMSRNESAT